MDVREKLVEILSDAGMGKTERNFLADRLIANGVTVQEYGYWVSYQSDEPYGSTDKKEWHKCSKCGKDANGRCYEDEWYSAPILSSYCPHCGSKMMPEPPKGGGVMKDDLEFLRGLGNCQDKEQMSRYIEEHRPKPMTNAQKIRSMSDQELSEMLWETGRNYRAVCADPAVDYTVQHEHIIDWLRKPAEGE